MVSHWASILSAQHFLRRAESSEAGDAFVCRLASLPWRSHCRSAVAPPRLVVRLIWRMASQ